VTIAAAPTPMPKSATQASVIALDIALEPVELQRVSPYQFWQTPSLLDLALSARTPNTAPTPARTAPAPIVEKPITRLLVMNGGGGA
jgi:hypothetical protein